MKIEIWDKSYNTVAYIEGTNVVLTQEINKISSLAFDVAEYNQYLVFGNYAIVKNEPYLIRTVRKTHIGKKLSVNIEAEHIATQLLNDISDEVPFVNRTCEEAMIAALQGNRYGWTFGETDITDRKTFDTFTYTNKLTMLLKIAEMYRGELEFVYSTRKVNIWHQLGDDTGYIINFSRNATELDVEEDGNEFGTRLYPLGKWNLTVAPINGGKKYIDSPNIDKYGIVDIKWKTDITNRQQLLEAAQLKLQGIENPTFSFKVSFVDLSKFIEEEVPILHLGDAVRVYDKDFGVNIVSRVRSIQECVDNPQETKITIDSATKAYRDWEEKLAKLLDTVESNQDVWDQVSMIDTSVEIEYGDKEAIEGQIFNFEKWYYDRPAFILSLDKYPTTLDPIVSPVTVYGEPVSTLNDENILVYTGVKLHTIGTIPVGYRCSLCAFCASPAQDAPIE